MVKTNKKTILAIVLTLIIAILMPIVVITLPKEDSTVVQAATLTDSQLEQRRANPGLYQTDSMSFVQVDGVDLTWDVVLSKYFASTSAGKLTKLKIMPAGDLVVGSVAGITDMSNFLANQTTITSVDLSNLDTSNVTNMTQMFYNCSSLKTIIFGNNFNTQKVTSMASVFWKCSSLTSIDLSKFDTSKTTTMLQMFSECTQLTNIDVSNFDTANVQTMQGLFGGCSALTKIDVSNFNFQNVTNCASMFAGCSLLTDIDISNFNFQNVTNSNTMFNACVNLKTIKFSTNLNTKKLTTMKNMFAGCSKFETLDLSGFNISNVTDLSGLILNCSSLTTIKFGNNFNASLTKVKSIFNSTGMANIPVKNIVLGTNFLASSETSMQSIFIYLDNLETVDFNGFDTSNITNMTTLFTDFTKLKTINFGSGINTSNVTSFNQMFRQCASLETLDLSGFNMQNAQDVTEMFYNCTALKTIKTPSQVSDVVTFNNSSLTSMYYKNQATGEVYSNKNAVLPTNATIVYTDYTIPTLSSAQKEERRKTSGAGIYLPGTMTLIKSWDEIVDDVVVDYDGVITLDTFNLADGDCDIVCGVATVNAVSLADCIFDADLTNLIFENFDNFYAQSVNLSSIEFPSSASKVAVAASVEFYGASNLEKVDLSIFDLSNSTGFDGGPILYFDGCTGLKEIKMPSAMPEMTMEELGLAGMSFKSSANPNVILEDTDTVTGGITLTAGTGTDTPDTPSTGVVTDMLGFVVTAVIVVAICYVATRKKKVQK